MSQLHEKEFYLGRVFDGKAGQATTESLYYDPADLTTHAVITGMTGSGKTGLGISLLEEAALKGLPAIVIDPKGDLTNLILHFPNQEPKDFEPWIDPEEARRQGKDLSVLAEETAKSWKDGLASWGLGKEELLMLKNETQYTIYTPGSSSGIPVNILSSFQSPDIPWEENKEILREKISSSVTALLGLVGMGDIDPLRSREHILLSNVLESAWSSGKSLGLTELILSVQNPSFDRLGAFPLDSFFPEKDRFSLAILLNNFLAAPSFQTWLEGQDLDIDTLLFMPDGKPRHSIFYLAHLSETERMFFVTLLYAAVETWMRRQRGTGGLRMLMYFDEIMGYLPPVANPPSRTVMLRMLKQARAFGVGQILATQNPVDVDYKALSNAGTWFVGRLQTDQDKQRLLDGLESAGGGFDRAQTDKMISGLGKRVFLLHNVHSKKDQLLQTRWVLNYLAGPMTRMQIAALNSLAGVSTAGASTAVQNGNKVSSAGQETKTNTTNVQSVGTGVNASSGYMSVRPAVPSPMLEYFLSANLGVSEAVDLMKINLSGAIQPEGILYRPALIAQAELRYYARKYNVDHTAHIGVLVAEENLTRVRWEDFAHPAVKLTDLKKDPMPQAKFSGLPGWLSDARKVKSLESEFLDWVYRNSEIRLKANDVLKVYAGPEVSSTEFREMCSEAANNLIAAELKKVELVYEKKLTTLEQKIKRQSLEVEEQQNELGQRRMEEMGTHGELLLSLFGGRKKSISSSLSKRRMTAQAKSGLEKEQQELQDLEKELDSLEKEYESAKQEVSDKWASTVNDVVEVPLSVMKKDVFPEIFGVVWLPYYLVKAGDRVREVPANESGR